MKKKLAPIPLYRWKVVIHNSEHKLYKRTYPRKKVFSVAHYTTPDKSFFGWVHNVSEGGVFIGTGEPLSPRTDITLAFTMPESDIPIETKGEVMWTGKNGMGLKFKEVDELTEGKIKSILSH